MYSPGSEGSPRVGEGEGAPESPIAHRSDGAAHRARCASARDAAAAPRKRTQTPQRPYPPFPLGCVAGSDNSGGSLQAFKDEPSIEIARLVRTAQTAR